ncbi:MAG: RlmE family RNA methyltransferase [Neisseriaceae bacterium]
MKKKKLNSRSRSSAAWMNEHVNDLYVQLAKREGYRSRAAYKLLEINEKDRLFRPGLRLVDLGCAPGGWSQVAARKMQYQGLILAVDILEMEPIKGVQILRGDFTDPQVLQDIEAILSGRSLDLVISDIAPNMGGSVIVDQAKSYYLAELALEFASSHLKGNGRFLVKVFQGSGYQDYVRRLKSTFCSVAVRKPKASRDRSRELYLLASTLR